MECWLVANPFLLSKIFLYLSSFCAYRLYEIGHVRWSLSIHWETIGDFKLAGRIMCKANLILSGVQSHHPRF